MGPSRLVLALLLGATLSPTPLAAQARPAVDPYTRGEAAAIENAGYSAIGRFLVAGVGTTEITEALGGIPILWLETEHFKIGSTLPETRTPGRKERRALVRAELARLEEKLPRVKKGTRKLDPWLRLHLYAQRLEEHYDELADLLGADPHSEPFLGVREKYGVLLFEKGSSVARYFQTYTGQGREIPWQHFFREQDALVFGTAEAFCEKEPEVEAALHADVVHGVTQILFEGFAGRYPQSPVWLSVGVSRWYARQVEPSRLPIAQAHGFNLNDDGKSEWERKVRIRARTDSFPPLQEMLETKDYLALDFEDHMLAWSRVDFLFSLGRERFARFARLVQGPDPGTQPWEELMLERQLEGLREHYGFTPAEFDAAWKAWVIETYEED